MRTQAIHLGPGVTLRVKFASSPPETQSEQATPFRGWRVPALAFLKAVGNRTGEATHAHCTRARIQAHTKPSSSSGPDTPCLRSGIPETESKLRRAGWGVPRSLPAAAPVTAVLFPTLAVTPHSPPSVPGSKSAHDRALRSSSHHHPPKSTDQLSRPSPVPSVHSPKQRHFLPGPKTFSSLRSAMRQETRSAAATTRFAQRPGG